MTVDGESGEPAYAIAERAVESKYPCIFSFFKHNAVPGKGKQEINFFVLFGQITCYICFTWISSHFLYEGVLV